jgi:hypothetical protein
LTDRNISLLDAKIYDAAEAAGARQCPNAILQAFQPDEFGRVGYPMRVTSNGELWRYVDVMHEKRKHHTIRFLLRGLTSSEFELFKTVTRIVDEYAQRQFGIRAQATAALLQAMHASRILRIVAGNERPTILEVGPGCGYLGMLLVLQGFPYVATEITQAFYLYQSHMLAQVATVLRELAVDSGDILTLEQPKAGEVVHVPWWKWVTANTDDVTLSVGILTVNHALCEMHPNSVAYLAAIGRKLLSNYAAGGALVFEGWGSDLFHSQNDVLRTLMATGFVLRHNEEDFVTAMELAAASRGEASSRAKSLNKKDLLRLILQRFPNTEKRVRHFSNRIPRIKQNLGKLLEGTSSRVGYYRGGSALSRHLREGRKLMDKEIVVHEPELDRFLNSYFGGSIPISGDEAFYQSLRPQR